MHGSGEQANGYAAHHIPPKWEGVWLYNQLAATASQISSKEATERAAHSTARNAVLIPISQGTEVTIVTEYIPFWYFTCTVSSIDA